MNVLLIDSQYCFLDFALRCQESGHTVRWFIGPHKDGNPSAVGKGLGMRIQEWEPSMKWADIILVSDNAKYVKALEGYRNRGFPIFGPNVETSQWELDRTKGQQVLAAAGIDIIPSTEFTNYDKAMTFVKANMKRYVSKPSGDADKALSYVAKSPADMVFMLGHWKKEGRLKAPFILQEFHGGVEMAVGGWFGKNGFSHWWCENFEHKKLMNDDLGQNTGEMGTVLNYTDDSRLAEMVLLPLEAELIRQGYTGYIDVSVIIGKDGRVWPLEFTTRPGWPLFQIQQQLHAGDPVEWMVDLLDGFDTFQPLEGVALGVVLAMPDFPYSRLIRKDYYGYPIYGIDKPRIRRHVHPAEMAWDKAPCEEKEKVVERDMWVTAGDYILIVASTGNTVAEAQKNTYSIIEQIEIPNSPFYRTDIGDRVMCDLKALQNLGFATSWKGE
ncbi:MAG: hypothetical protein KGL39_09790 [Patescibacteria group bacterium]|nr:hypothetical protein [Patescibacteria group bacterium]